MTEYIISDELLSSICQVCYRAGKAGKEAFTVRTPSVEIVRCRDCEHSYAEGTCCRMFAAYEPIPGGDEYEEQPALVDPNGYCYLGERREDA